MILITNLKMPALCGVTIHITPQGRVYNEDTGCDIGKAVELQEDIDLIDRNSVKKTLCEICECFASCNEETCDTCVWHSWLTGVCYADEPCDNNSSYTPEDSEWAEEGEG